MQQKRHEKSAFNGDLSFEKKTFRNTTLQC